MKKAIRDIQPGDRISLGVIRDPRDPSDFVHDWSDVVVVEPLTEVYRVHTGKDVIIMQGDDEVEVDET